MSQDLVFLKLGGSLITEKDKVAAPRLDVLTRLANEIAAARAAQPVMQLLLGHGSGSFGHVPAKKHNTRAGVQGAQQWLGFAEVRQQAASLNHLVMEALLAAGLSAIVYPPSKQVRTHDRRVKTWDIEPIRAALNASQLPVVYGDAVYDNKRGGTIISTEELFLYLARALQPVRILLAGDEDGVYEDYPQRKKMVAKITPANVADYAKRLSGGMGADVTGGMAGKVAVMLDLIKQLPSCEVRIFSGLEAGAVQQALNGKALGTLLRVD